MTHNELKQKALSKEDVKKEYDELSVEFSVLRQLLSTIKSEEIECI